MGRYLLVALSMLSHGYFCCAQYLDEANAVSVALSGANLAYGLHGSPFVSNPAILSYTDQPVAVISYHNRFMLPGLGTSTFAGSLPTHGGAFRTSISHFGTSSLYESHITLSYGRRLSRWFDAGIRLNFHRMGAESLNYGYSAISGDMGLGAALTSELYLALQAINITGSGYIDGPVPLDNQIRTAICYSKEQNFYTSLEFSLVNFDDCFLKMGFEYYLVQQLCIRTGLQVASGISYSFGLGVRTGRFHLDLGMQEHMVLGTSSVLSLGYVFNRHD